MSNISPRRRRSQGGYLMEIPLLLMFVVITVALLLPRLSILGRKILISIAAMPVLFALYYMIVTPGWTPGNTRRPGPVARWILFLIAAIVIVGAVVIFDLGFY